MEGRERIRVIKTARIIPLTPVDCGGGDVRDVTLLETTSPEGIKGLGSAYTGVNQLRDALTHYQQDPATLKKHCQIVGVPWDDSIDDYA